MIIVIEAYVAFAAAILALVLAVRFVCGLTDFAAEVRDRAQSRNAEVPEKPDHRLIV